MEGSPTHLLPAIPIASSMSTLIEGQRLLEIQKSVLPSDLAKEFVKVLTSKDNEANLEMYLTQLKDSILDS